MRPRSISVKPVVHWGLGLDEYTQVTSPLRRYTDLLCHQQIRAWLAGNEGRGGEPLGEEEILLRVSAAEAAASATSRAERASRAHWLAVYLSGMKDAVWDAVIFDRKGNRGTAIIPALGIETQLSLRGNEEPNDTISLRLVSAKIPEAETGFAVV
jgi:exoribonuclease-2